MYSEVWLSIQSSCCLDSEVEWGVLCVTGAWGVQRVWMCCDKTVPPPTEYSVYQLAEHEVQAPPSELIHWMASGVPPTGGECEIVSQVPDKVRAKPYLVTIVGFYLQIQLTDFENAALVVFVVLLTRAILSFKLNLYIPMSKVSPGDDTISKVKGQYDIEAWSKATHMKHTSDIWISASCAK